MTQGLKIMVVGDGAVGKTCLLLRYINDIFLLELVPSVVDNHVTNIIYNGNQFNLGLWDTAGGEDYGRLRALSYPQTDVFLICMPIVRRNASTTCYSYERVWKGWYPDVTHHCPATPFILVGTKSDLRDTPEICKFPPYTFSEMRNFARRMGAFAYVECSALTGKNVKQVFNVAVKAVIGPYIPIKPKKQGKFLSGLRNKFQTFSVVSTPNTKIGMTAKIVADSEENVRWGHAAVYIIPNMYIFGGAHDTVDQVVLEDNSQIWNGNKWENISYSGTFNKRTFLTASLFLDDKPVTRTPSQIGNSGDSADSYETTVKAPKVLIFGGKSNGYRADIHVFNPETKLFALVTTTGKAPSPRYGITSATYNNHMYIFGGYNNDGFLCNDLFKLNTETKDWQQIAIKEALPPPRMFHTAECFNNIMVVYGGKGEKNTTLDDMYLIDLDSGISKLHISEKSPGSRQNHACAAISKDEMVLIGGVTKGGALSSDVFIFSLVNKQWIKVNISGQFGKREMHSAVFTGSEIWVHGGKDERNNPVACTRLQPDHLVPRFYTVLPKYLTLLILSFLSPVALTRFGQTSHVTHSLAEEDALWIELCKKKDPDYQYIPPPTNDNITNSNNNTNVSTNSNNDITSTKTRTRSENNNINNNNNCNKSVTNNNNKINNTYTTPKRHLSNFTSVWINSFEVPPDPKSLDCFVP